MLGLTIVAFPIWGLKLARDFTAVTDVLRPYHNDLGIPRDAYPKLLEAIVEANLSASMILLGVLLAFAITLAILHSDLGAPSAANAAVANSGSNPKVTAARSMRLWIQTIRIIATLGIVVLFFGGLYVVHFLGIASGFLEPEVKARLFLKLVMLQSSTITFAALTGGLSIQCLQRLIW
jgi:hypothetical protein